MFRTVSSQIVLSKRVFGSPAARSFHAAVVTTAPRALSTDAAPKVKAPRAPRTPKPKVVKEVINIKVAEGDTATQTDLIDGIEQLTGLEKNQIHAVLTALPEVIVKNLQEDKTVRLHGIGILKKKHSKGRTYVNIKTKEPYTTEDKDVVKIAVASGLKNIFKKE